MIGAPGFLPPLPAGEGGVGDPTAPTMLPTTLAIDIPHPDPPPQAGEGIANP